MAKSKTPSKDTNHDYQYKLVPAVNRIIIGDVGSGKTIVAFITALSFLKGINHGQASLLAPTEVLAFQHYQKLEEYISKWTNPWFKKLIRVFLTGKQVLINGEKSTKKKLDSLIKEKNFSHIFWVGTQALLFNQEVSPELVMVDEQHRFGVRQRQHLTTQTTQTGSHFLSFTATPIPRTLALTVYKDLKPHFLPTLPGRSHIATSRVGFSKFEEVVIASISQHLQAGGKVYLVCAKVEDKDTQDAAMADIWSVGKTAQLLEKYFPDQILLVHGKLKDKKQTLSEFKENTTKNILVATTVVEVGVDVPQATLMVILNSERFGLAALHQIRGRVGRNSLDYNQCLLITPDQFLRSKRLQYLCQYSDGFEIAEKDLELRGSGDMLGSSQSGFVNEVENLLGLNPEMYYQIESLVDSLDVLNLPPEMSRLESYLDKEYQKVWQE